MNKNNLIKRYILFGIGLYINSFGVSFITKASLGTSPISSIPYTLSLYFKPTLGMFTLYMSIFLILIQMLLLRNNFPKHYFLQIPISIVFSWFIDLAMEQLSFMNPTDYLTKLLLLILGCFLLGVGVYLEMVADVVMLPGEAFVNVISLTFHTDFSKTKIVFDSSMAIVAGILGFILFHRLKGIGEGTLIAAILVGAFAKLLKKKLLFLEYAILEKPQVR